MSSRNTINGTLRVCAVEEDRLAVHRARGYVTTKREKDWCNPNLECLLCLIVIQPLLNLIVVDSPTKYPIVVVDDHGGVITAIYLVNVKKEIPSKSYRNGSCRHHFGDQHRPLGYKG